MSNQICIIICVTMFNKYIYVIFADRVRRAWKPQPPTIRRRSRRWRTRSSDALPIWLRRQGRRGQRLQPAGAVRRTTGRPLFMSYFIQCHIS